MRRTGRRPCGIREGVQRLFGMKGPPTSAETATSRAYNERKSPVAGVLGSCAPCCLCRCRKRPRTRQQPWTCAVIWRTSWHRSKGRCAGDDGCHAEGMQNLLACHAAARQMTPVTRDVRGLNCSVNSKASNANGVPFRSVLRVEFFPGNGTESTNRSLATLSFPCGRASGDGLRTLTRRQARCQMVAGGFCTSLSSAVWQIRASTLRGLVRARERW